MTAMLESSLARLGAWCAAYTAILYPPPRRDHYGLFDAHINTPAAALGFWCEANGILEMASVKIVHAVR